MGIDVALDPSIELLGAADLLGAPAAGSASGAGGAYVASLRRSLEPFRSHPAVVLNARRHALDRNYFHRKDLLLLRGAPPELAFDPAFDSCRGEAERGGQWEPWLSALRDFARAARFERALAAAAPALDAELAELRRRAAAGGHVAALEAYSGLPFRGRYRLIVSALCSRGPSLNRVWTRDDGTHEIVSILRPSSYESLDAVVWHELGHAVLDMTANLYDHELRDAPLSLGPKLKNNCRNWLHGMREHFVRAVMLRLIARERGEAAAEREYRLEEFSARPHLAAFLRLLREYEDSRSRWPTLAHFYPRLAAAFPRPARARVAAAEGGDGWHDALRLLAGPFLTRAQRERALEHLDLLLSSVPDPRLLVRRAALLFLLDRRERALADVAALLDGRPGDVASLLRWARGRLRGAAKR